MNAQPQPPASQSALKNINVRCVLPQEVEAAWRKDVGGEASTNCEATNATGISEAVMSSSYVLGGPPQSDEDGTPVSASSHLPPLVALKAALTCRKNTEEGSDATTQDSEQQQLRSLRLLAQVWSSGHPANKMFYDSLRGGATEQPASAPKPSPFGQPSKQQANSSPSLLFPEFYSKEFKDLEDFWMVEEEVEPSASDDCGGMVGGAAAACIPCVLKGHDLLLSQHAVGDGDGGFNLLLDAYDLNQHQHAAQQWSAFLTAAQQQAAATGNVTQCSAAQILAHMQSEGIMFPSAASRRKGRLLTAILAPLVFSLNFQPMLPSNEGPTALILCPTRQLCDEAMSIVWTLAKHTHLVVHNTLRGAPLLPADRRADIVITTPGHFSEWFALEGRGAAVPSGANITIPSPYSLRKVARVACIGVGEMMGRGFTAALRNIFHATPPPPSAATSNGQPSVNGAGGRHHNDVVRGGRTTANATPQPAIPLGWSAACQKVLLLSSIPGTPKYDDELSLCRYLLKPRPGDPVPMTYWPVAILPSFSTDTANGEEDTLKRKRDATDDNGRENCDPDYEATTSEPNGGEPAAIDSVLFCGVASLGSMSLRMMANNLLQGGVEAFNRGYSCTCQDGTSQTATAIPHDMFTLHEDCALQHYGVGAGAVRETPSTVHIRAIARSVAQSQRCGHDAATATATVPLTSLHPRTTFKTLRFLLLAGECNAIAKDVQQQQHPLMERSVMKENREEVDHEARGGKDCVVACTSSPHTCSVIFQLSLRQNGLAGNEPLRITKGFKSVVDSLDGRMFAGQCLRCIPLHTNTAGSSLSRGITAATNAKLKAMFETKLSSLTWHNGAFYAPLGTVNMLKNSLPNSGVTSVHTPNYLLATIVLTGVGSCVAALRAPLRLVHNGVPVATCLEKELVRECSHYGELAGYQLTEQHNTSEEQSSDLVADRCKLWVTFKNVACAAEAKMCLGLGQLKVPDSSGRAGALVEVKVTMAALV